VRIVAWGIIVVVVVWVVYVILMTIAAVAVPRHVVAPNQPTMTALFRDRVLV
jgi:hypothetical protein